MRSTPLFIFMDINKLQPRNNRLHFSKHFYFDEASFPFGGIQQLPTDLKGNVAHINSSIRHDRSALLLVDCHSKFD